MSDFYFLVITLYFYNGNAYLPFLEKVKCYLKIRVVTQACWFMLVIPTLRRLRQED
jgi:hypothetical protein